MKENKKNNKVISTIKKIFRFIFKFIKGLVIFLFFSAVILGLVLSYKFKPKYDELKSEAYKAVSDSTPEYFRINSTGYIYDANGNIITNLNLDGKSTYLKSDDIPDNVKNAFIAVEDRNFYKHKGFDAKGIIRVCYRYALSKGTEKHGASTITQQLIKNRFLSSEVTMQRKIKEIFYAVELEKKYSKDEILEFYINDIYYANQFYGIEAASEGYFDKTASELTLSEAAFLCAIPNSPTYYDPFTHKENTIERRNKILNDMLECGFITEKEYNKAIKEDIKLNPHKDKEIEFQNYETTYAVKCAVEYLMKYNGFKFEYSWKTKEDYDKYIERYNESYKENKDLLYSGGYSVYTSLDGKVQKQMQTTLDEALEDYKEKQENGVYELQGAVTCIDNKNGKVIAIIGGRNQDSGNIYTLNRAYQSYRQPGSTMKPLVVYTPALQNGYNKSSTLYNISVKEANKPGTDINSLTGSAISLSRAVEKSSNGAAVYLFNQIGVKYGMSFLPNMHFDKIMESDMSIASGLGGLTYGVTTEQMAGAYYTIYNHGKYKNVDCILSIKDAYGNEIYKDEKEQEVYTVNAADDMTEILKGVVKQGTAYSINWYSYTKTEAAGKTGTTNDDKDVWFCGFTPYYTISVWVGYDQPKEMKLSSSFTAKIWRDCMLPLIEDKEELKLEKSKDYDTSDAVYHGRSNVKPSDTAYEDYLPGRDDGEELSSGYTVYDYRVDRTIGEQIKNITNQMTTLDKDDSSYIDNLNALRTQAQSLINDIYSQKYTTEMTNLVNDTYANCTN